MCGGGGGGGGGSLQCLHVVSACDVFSWNVVAMGLAFYYNFSVFGGHCV